MIVASSRTFRTFSGEQGFFPPRIKLTFSLYSTLLSTERFLCKEVSRGPAARLLRSKTDLGKIQEYRDALRRALDKFVVRLKYACATEL